MSNERRLLAGACGAILRKRSHAEDAEAQRTTREEGKKRKDYP